MPRSVRMNTLIGQEKCTTTLFLTLLVTVIFFLDLSIPIVTIRDSLMVVLIPYLCMFILLPLAIYFVRKKNPRHVKYLFFLTFLIVSFLNEVIIYWGSSDYRGGNLAEIYFIVFSPIFISYIVLYRFHGYIAALS